MLLAQRSAGAQTHGGFVEQLVGHGPGLFGGAHLGGEHVGVADGLEVLGLGHVEVFAVEPVPEALAPDRAPELAGLFAAEGQQILHGVDALGVQPLLSARADAGQVAQGELAERFGRMSSGRATRPSGFSMSLATLAR